MHGDADVIAVVAHRIEQELLLTEQRAVQPAEHGCTTRIVCGLVVCHHAAHAQPALDRRIVQRAGELQQAEGLLELTRTDRQCRNDRVVDPRRFHLELALREVRLQVAAQRIADADVRSDPQAPELERSRRRVIHARRVELVLNATSQIDRDFGSFLGGQPACRTRECRDQDRCGSSQFRSPSGSVFVTHAGTCRRAVRAAPRLGNGRVTAGGEGGLGAG